MVNVRDMQSKLTHFDKYARFIESKQRREVFEETVDRSKKMMLSNLASSEDLSKNFKIAEKINWAYSFVYDKKVLPSMRNLQFAGAAIEKNHARMYNCWYAPISDDRTISDMVFLLLSGGGCGYSVRKRHVSQLPAINKPDQENVVVHVVEDTIEGWAEAVRIRLHNYWYGGPKIEFDWSLIRPRGSLLKTSGGRAPGPEKIRESLKLMDDLLKQTVDGEKLSSLEVHKLVCMAASAVKAGGIRRSALICLFDYDDDEMTNCKTGNWYEHSLYLENSNNSACFEDKDEAVAIAKFRKFWAKASVTRSGDPGFVKAGKNDGWNPCVEVNLNPNQACNLTELNGRLIKTQEDLNRFAQAAAIIGTCQAWFTKFHYISPKWQEATEKEALIGVGITGITDGEVLNLDLGEAANIVKNTNAEMADLLGINHSARCTVIKPSGTTSCIFGCASGIHDWHYRCFVRHVGLSKDTVLYKFLAEKVPGLVVDNVMKPGEAFIAYPVKIDSHIPVAGDLSPIQFLDRVKDVQKRWVLSGTRYGELRNNVSSTVTIGDDQWDDVRDWICDNWSSVSALSWTPKFETSPEMKAMYPQPPFMVITEKEYHDRLSKLNDFDLRELIEIDDQTALQGEAACAGGACEVV